VNFVDHLAKKYDGRVAVELLSRSIYAHMSKTAESNFLMLLKNWPARNRVRVPAVTAGNTRRSLNEMREL